MKPNPKAMRYKKRFVKKKTMHIFDPFSITAVSEKGEAMYSLH
jgi:hypothetical protein